MKTHSATDEYLEAMLVMQQQRGYIRSTDVANYLGVTKPSVTYTTKRLKSTGHITMEHNGKITLTDSGMELASGLLERRQTLKDLFKKLGVSDEVAEADASKVEYALSAETYKAICNHIKK